MEFTNLKNKVDELSQRIWIIIVIILILIIIGALRANSLEAQLNKKLDIKYAKLYQEYYDVSEQLTLLYLKSKAYEYDVNRIENKIKKIQRVLNNAELPKKM